MDFYSQFWVIFKKEERIRLRQCKKLFYLDIWVQLVFFCSRLFVLVLGFFGFFYLVGGLGVKGRKFLVFESRICFEMFIRKRSFVNLVFCFFVEVSMNLRVVCVFQLRLGFWLCLVLLLCLFFFFGEDNRYYLYKFYCGFQQGFDSFLFGIQRCVFMWCCCERCSCLFYVNFR